MRCRRLFQVVTALFVPLGNAFSVGCASAADPAELEAANPQNEPFDAGISTAWIRFAHDIPDPDLNRFREQFEAVSAAGGNTIRWWLSTNGTQFPRYDAEHYALGISHAEIDAVRSVLDLAAEWNLRVIPSLWSFDMLQGAIEKIPIDITRANRMLLTEERARQVYIDNVLTPLVSAIGQHPALHSWELFNEAEGMTTEYGWVPEENRISMHDVQATVNWFASAIHTAVPSARVTSAAWTFASCANVNGWTDRYANSALFRAGERFNGNLDYYEVHYFEDTNDQEPGREERRLKISPFAHNASHWGLDKPIFIGEFWSIQTHGIEAGDLFIRLRELGYRGAIAWQYFNLDKPGPRDPNTHEPIDTRWPSMKAGLEKLSAPR